MNIELIDLSVYELCNYIRENELGEFDMLKILKAYTDDFNLELLKRLDWDISFYLFQEGEIMEAKFTTEDIDNAIKERTNAGIEIPYIMPKTIEELTPRQIENRKKAKNILFQTEKIINLEALLFPYEFYSVRTFRRLVQSKIKELQPNQKYTPISIRLNDYMEKTDGSDTATLPPPEPELIDFSEGTDTKTKLAILYELGILNYLREKAYPINSANKIASLLSAIIGGEAKTLQTYINPIISPDTDQRNAPKKIHKEKARQILQKLGYVAKKL